MFFTPPTSPYATHENTHAQATHAYAQTQRFPCVLRRLAAEGSTTPPTLKHASEQRALGRRHPRARESLRCYVSILKCPLTSYRFPCLIEEFVFLFPCLCFSRAPLTPVQEPSTNFRWSHNLRVDVDFARDEALCELPDPPITTWKLSADLSRCVRRNRSLCLESELKISGVEGVCKCVRAPGYSSVLSRSEHRACAAVAEISACFLVLEQNKSAIDTRRKQRNKTVWWRMAGSDARSFKPQKLSRATNSFYKADCALIPVTSKAKGKTMAHKWHLAQKICKNRCCQRFFLHTPSVCSLINPLYQLTRRWRHKRTHIRTFPGGDESCQELAEVGSGVCRILLSQRKSFKLGGRAPVPDVGLLHAVGVSLEEGCSAQTQTAADLVTTYCRLLTALWPAAGLRVPPEGAGMERRPPTRSCEERGSPKQLVHRTASTTHTHNPAVIYNTEV